MERISPNTKELKYIRRRFVYAKTNGIDLGGDSLFNDIMDAEIFCWRSKLINRRFKSEKKYKDIDEI